MGIGFSTKVDASPIENTFVLISSRVKKRTLKINLNVLPRKKISNLVL